MEIEEGKKRNLTDQLLELVFLQIEDRNGAGHVFLDVHISSKVLSSSGALVLFSTIVKTVECKSINRSISDLESKS